MSECSHDCSTCSSNCASRKPSKEELLAPANPNSRVKKVIGVVSGKGGVGKSFITSYLSVLMNRKGYKSAVLDADITGPSIPKAFGMNEKAVGNEAGLLPVESKTGVKVMSINLLLDSEETPVLFRGPVIAGVVKQFWSDTIWEDVDYMFVDMPPGTGDVPLTVFQSLPLDGIIIVTSPQKLVSMIVSKAVNMAKTMDIPILGVVENYSYVLCGNCGEKVNVFGESHLEGIAQNEDLKILGRMPIDPVVAGLVDSGCIEDLKVDWLNGCADYIESVLPIEEEEMIEDGKMIAIMSNDGVSGAKFSEASQLILVEVKDNLIVSRQVNDVSDATLEEIVTFLQGLNVKHIIAESFSTDAVTAFFTYGITPVPEKYDDCIAMVSSFVKNM